MYRKSVSVGIQYHTDCGSGPIICTVCYMKPVATEGHLAVLYMSFVAVGILCTAVDRTAVGVGLEYSIVHESSN